MFRSSAATGAVGAGEPAFGAPDGRVVVLAGAELVDGDDVEAFDDFADDEDGVDLEPLPPPPHAARIAADNPQAMTQIALLDAAVGTPPPFCEDLERPPREQRPESTARHPADAGGRCSLSGVTGTTSVQTDGSYSPSLWGVYDAPERVGIEGLLDDPVTSFHQTDRR